MSKVDHWRIKGLTYAKSRGKIIECSSYEVALSLARTYRDAVKANYDVIEVDEHGNETPVAHVGCKP